MPDKAPDRSLEELERIINGLRLARYHLGVQSQMLDSSEYEEAMEFISGEIAAFEAERDNLLREEQES